MRSLAEDDVPLLTEEKEGVDFYPSTCESETVSIRRCYLAAALFVSVGLNVILLLATAYLAVKQSQSIEWKGARPVFSKSYTYVSQSPILIQFSFQHLRGKLWYTNSCSSHL